MLTHSFGPKHTQAGRQVDRQAGRQAGIRTDRHSLTHSLSQTDDKVSRRNVRQKDNPHGTAPNALRITWFQYPFPERRIFVGIVDGTKLPAVSFSLELTESDKPDVKVRTDVLQESLMRG